MVSRDVNGNLPSSFLMKVIALLIAITAGLLGIGSAGFWSWSESLGRFNETVREGLSTINVSLVRIEGRQDALDIRIASINEATRIRLSGLELSDLEHKKMAEHYGASVRLRTIEREVAEQRIKLESDLGKLHQQISSIRKVISDETE